MRQMRWKPETCSVPKWPALNGSVERSHPGTTPGPRALWPAVADVPVTATERAFCVHLYAASAISEDAWADLRFADAAAICRDLGLDAADDYETRMGRRVFLRSALGLANARTHSASTGRAAAFAAAQGLLAFVRTLEAIERFPVVPGIDDDLDDQE